MTKDKCNKCKKCYKCCICIIKTNKCDNDKCTCFDECDKSIDCLSIPEKRILKHLEQALLYKKIQKETICSLREIVNNIICMLRSTNDCNKTDPKCYKSDIMSASEQYVQLGERTCDGKQIVINGPNRFYGSINNSTGLPIFYNAGAGGIATSELYGQLIINKVPTYVNVGDDIAFVADKIRKSNGKEFAVVDGTEIGILVQNADTINLIFKSMDLGNTSQSIVVTGNQEMDYCNFLKQVRDIFESYIAKIWIDYSTNTPILRLILKQGYTIGVSSNIAGSFIITTYCNNLPVNTGTPSPLTPTTYYCMGYLLFFDICHTFNYTFPAGWIGPSIYGDTLYAIECTNSYLKNLITFSLMHFWRCKTEVIYKICVHYDKGNTNIIEIKAFFTWGKIMRSMLKALDFDNTYYDGWRRWNVQRSLESLTELLDNIEYMIENQKDLLKVVKCDFIAFCLSCGKCSTHKKKCCDKCK